MTARAGLQAGRPRAEVRLGQLLLSAWTFAASLPRRLQLFEHFPAAFWLCLKEVVCLAEVVRELIELPGGSRWPSSVPVVALHFGPVPGSMYFQVPSRRASTRACSTS